MCNKPKNENFVRLIKHRLQEDYVNLEEQCGYTTGRSCIDQGSIVSDYGLDDRAIGVRSPAVAKDFSSSLCVQTGSGARPASCTMGTGGPAPGVKAWPGRDADHSPPSSAKVVNEYELYLLSPQAPPWRVAGLLTFSH
jgi:hypothetical protein